MIGNQRGQPPGTNSTTLAVSTPLQLVDVTIGGASVARAANIEYGRSVYTASLDVPSGGQVTVVFKLQGSIDMRHGYDLALLPQPLVNADQVDVHVKATTDPGHDIASRTGELQDAETVSTP